VPLPIAHCESHSLPTIDKSTKTSLLVRGYDPGPLRLGPQWTVHDVSLEDLVLAYLANGSAGALPGPVDITPRREART